MPRVGEVLDYHMGEACWTPWGYIALQPHTSYIPLNKIHLDAVHWFLFSKEVGIRVLFYDSVGVMLISSSCLVESTV